MNPKVISFLFALLLWLALSPAQALPSAQVAPLAGDDAEARMQAVAQIAASGDPLAIRILEALADSRLFIDKDLAVFTEGDKTFKVEDGTAAAAPKVEAITANNRLRAEVESAVASIRLFDADAKVRGKAAQDLSSNAGAGQRPMIIKALEAKTGGRRRCAP
jgi:urea transport system permease protein